MPYSLIMILSELMYVMRRCTEMKKFKDILRKRYIFVLFKEKLNRIAIQRFCCLARSSFTTSNSDTCATGNYVHNSRGRIGLYYRRSSDQRIYRDDGAHAFFS